MHMPQERSTEDHRSREWCLGFRWQQPRGCLHNLRRSGRCSLVQSLEDGTCGEGDQKPRRGDVSTGERCSLVHRPEPRDDAQRTKLDRSRSRGKRWHHASDHPKLQSMLVRPIEREEARYCTHLAFVRSFHLGHRNGRWSWPCCRSQRCRVRQ